MFMRYNVFIVFTALITCLICGCRKVSLEFTYAPLLPLAGDTVRFTNMSSGGEDYIWNFGDNQTSTVKNPTHIYRQAGSYIVTLKANKSDKSCQHVVTVGTPEPSFAPTADSLFIFTPDTFVASLWNPYGVAMTYRWTVGDDVRTITDTDRDTLVVYFTRKGEHTISLELTEQERTHTIEKTFSVYNLPAPALLMQSSEQAYYQRMYAIGVEDQHLLDYDRGVQLLAVASTEPVAIDAIDRKAYRGGDNGLYVCHTNGQDSVCVDARAVYAVTISTSLNRLFYATEQGVYMMPLVHSRNNRFTDIPAPVNECSGIIRLAVDETPF